ENIEEKIFCCDIIDLGAESTYPGTDPISAEEEIRLLEPALKFFRKFNKPISVDTYKSQTAEFAINQGADIINDISGGILDKNMFNIISQYNVSYVMGHIQNTPKNMQENPIYIDIISEISEHFQSGITTLTEKGFPLKNIILDPCICFGKNTRHNIEILKNIKSFKKFSLPLLMGTSRKSFHRELAHIENDRDMLLATLTTNIYSVIQGADIIRVHDTKEFYLIKELLINLL
ncbi:MAG: dihydropteroate synthase, partial [Armatimonadetes bacterium]|nr:dihydropteroate synthase [Candidatus Hippobium faecium]